MGRAFYVDAKGKKVYPKEDPPTIEIDEHGHPFIVDSLGNRQKVLMDQNGQPYYMDKSGKKVMVLNEKVENYQMVMKDENG